MRYIILLIILSLPMYSQTKDTLSVIDYNTLTTVIQQSEKTVQDLAQKIEQAQKELLMRQGELQTYYNLRAYYLQTRAADTVKTSPKKKK